MRGYTGIFFSSTARPSGGKGLARARVKRQRGNHSEKTMAAVTMAIHSSGFMQRPASG
ncbi:hypothetical protein D3C72_1860110 [compost metagenome]